MASSKKLLFNDKSLNASPAPADAAQASADPETITITPAAAAEMARQAEKRGTPGAAIRVGIRGGGCSGYSYLFDWADGEPRAKDHVIEAHGVTVYVDHKSMTYLKGTVLDFVSSMMSHGFKFHNPNAKGTCGCGESLQF